MGRARSLSLRLLVQPRSYQIPTLSWHCIQDETMNFSLPKGAQRPAAIHCTCWALDACIYPPSRQNFLPQNHITLLLGKATLHFGRALATSPQTTLQSSWGKKEKKNKCIWGNCFLWRESILWWKNFTCGPWNNLHFALFGLLIIEGRSGACWMSDWKGLLLSWPFLHISLVQPEYPQGFSYFWFDPLMEDTDHSIQRGVWRHLYTHP